MRPPSRREMSHPNQSLTSIRVSNKSLTKKVAGAMAKIARECRDLDVLAGSASAVNTALKASAVARQFTADDDIENYLVPNFLVVDEKKRVNFRMVTTKPKQVAMETDVVEYMVGNSTEAGALAGAVAARLREGKTARLAVVGATAAMRAAMAATLAAQYAECEVRRWTGERTKSREKEAARLAAEAEADDKAGARRRDGTRPMEVFCFRSGGGADASRRWTYPNDVVRSCRNALDRSPSHAARVVQLTGASPPSAFSRHARARAGVDGQGAAAAAAAAGEKDGSLRQPRAPPLLNAPTRRMRVRARPVAWARVPDGRGITPCAACRAAAGRPQPSARTAGAALLSPVVRRTGQRPHRDASLAPPPPHTPSARAGRAHNASRLCAHPSLRSPARALPTNDRSGAAAGVAAATERDAAADDTGRG